MIADPDHHQLLQEQYMIRVFTMCSSESKTFKLNFSNIMNVVYSQIEVRVHNFRKFTVILMGHLYCEHNILILHLGYCVHNILILHLECIKVNLLIKLFLYLSPIAFMQNTEVDRKLSKLNTACGLTL